MKKLSKDFNKYSTRSFPNESHVTGMAADWYEDSKHTMLQTRFYAQKRVDDKWDVFKEQETSKSSIGIGSFQLTTSLSTSASSVDLGIASKQEALKKLSELEQSTLLEMPERVRQDILKKKLPKNHFSKG